MEGRVGVNIHTSVHCWRPNPARNAASFSPRGAHTQDQRTDMGQSCTVAFCAWLVDRRPRLSLPPAAAALHSHTPVRPIDAVATPTPAFPTASSQTTSRTSPLDTQTNFHLLPQRRSPDISMTSPTHVDTASSLAALSVEPRTFFSPFATASARHAHSQCHAARTRTHAASIHTLLHTHTRTRSFRETTSTFRQHGHTRIRTRSPLSLLSLSSLSPLSQTCHQHGHTRIRTRSPLSLLSPLSSLSSLLSSRFSLLSSILSCL